MHIVWEEIGDVLHGLGEDRGWTSKPDLLFGRRLGMDSISITFMCAYYIEVFLHVIDTALQCVSNGKYEVF